MERIFIFAISGEAVVANCPQKKIDTLIQRINGLEKKIGWFKLVAKTSEPEIEQKYL